MLNYFFYTIQNTYIKKPFPIENVHYIYINIFYVHNGRSNTVKTTTSVDPNYM